MSQSIVAFFAGILAFFAGIFGAPSAQMPPPSQTAAVAVAVQEATSTDLGQATATSTATTQPQPASSGASGTLAQATPATPTVATTQTVTPQPIVVNQMGISESELNNRLNTLENKITSLIYNFTGSQSGGSVSSPAGSIASGGVWNAIAGTNKIDNLSGVTISNSTIDTASIPDLSGSYLSLNGGTLSGLLNLTNASSSQFSIFNNAYFGGSATSTFDTLGSLSLAGSLSVSTTTATSTFSGNVLFSGDLIQKNLSLASDRLAFRDLLFYDDFNRADTSVGQLGTSTSGHAYDMRGVSAQSGNAVTQIQDGRWVSSAGDVTYAIQTLPTNVTHMGVRASWATGNGGASSGTLGVIISPDKTGSNLYLNAGAHIIITRSTWTIQYIDNSSFVTVKTGSFSPTLSADGTSYPFEIRIDGPVMYYSFAGVTGSASSPFFVTHAGTYATWEHYYGSASVADLLRIEAVWAGTALVSSGSLYDTASNGNVGVGTSTPWGKLSVTNTGTSPSFIVEDSTSPDTTPFVVDAAGNVGVGVVSPSDKLTVYENLARTSFTGSSAGTALLINANGTGNYTALDFGNYQSTAAGVPESRIASIRTSSGSFLQFGTTNNYAGITNTAMTVDPSGRLGVASTTPWRTLSVTGTVGFDGLTGSTGAGSLCLSANKEVVYNSGSDSCLSSTRATKHDIIALNLDALTLVDSLQSVSFIYNNDASSTVRYGFIAEDAAAVDAHFATYDQNGSISGIDDRSIISVVVKAVQEIWAKVAENTTKIAELFEWKNQKDQQIATLEARIAALESGQTASAAASSDSAAPAAPPTIQVNGNNPAHIAIGATYSDLGAQITGPTEADKNLGISVFVGSTPYDQAVIDTSTATTYHIYYVATNSYGAATSSRTVIVGDEAADEETASSTPETTTEEQTDEDNATTTEQAADTNDSDTATTTDQTASSTPTN